MKSNDSGEAQLIIFAVVSRDQDKAKGCLPTITSELQKDKWTTLNVEFIELALKDPIGHMFWKVNIVGYFLRSEKPFLS